MTGLWPPSALKPEPPLGDHRRLPRQKADRKRRLVATFGPWLSSETAAFPPNQWSLKSPSVDSEPDFVGYNQRFQTDTPALVSVDLGDSDLDGDKLGVSVNPVSLKSCRLSGPLKSRLSLRSSSSSLGPSACLRSAKRPERDFVSCDPRWARSPKGIPRRTRNVRNRKPPSLGPGGFSLRH